MYKTSLTITAYLVFIGLSTFASQAQAVNWTKLNESKQSILLLDKESVIEQNNLKKAWLKIKYKTIQKNYENPEIEFDLSKVLWYFNCAEQKSATSQVAQYLSDEMVFSAGIDVKKAEFIDPVPETDVDIAMRFTCGYDRKAEEEKIAKAIADKKAAAEAKKKAEEEAKAAAKLAAEQAEKEAASVEAAKKAEEEKAEKAAAELAAKEGADPKKKKKKKSTEWSYDDETGPEHWAELKTDFATCANGRNQSPVNIDKTVKAKLEKIRNIQKFPGKEMLNDGRIVQINFAEGNMLLIDDEPYQMKHLQFHSPSEHTIHDQAFPLEAEFVHLDSKDNITIMSVLFKEGAENKAIAKLLEQIPTSKGKTVALQSRIAPKDLMPTNPSYYRLTGSLTTPPCTEGVKWIVLKTPLTASKAQINEFKNATKHDNNRPIQPLNGRAVLE